MPRFFADKNLINEVENEIVITGGDAFHIARSLRMAVGDEITLCDGEGGVYLCRLADIKDERCLCDIVKKCEAKSELPVPVSLFMGYPKGDKLETVIQKAVELGAHEIIPFESSRCIKRPKADRAEKQLLRFNKIAEEAAKQCGRAILPKVHPTLSYSEMLECAGKAALALFCYEDEDTTSLKEALGGNVPDSVAVVVGSEGGFSPEEAEKAKAAGLISVSLGPRILRCETAPDYVLAAISYRFEL